MTDTTVVFAETKFTKGLSRGKFCTHHNLQIQPDTETVVCLDCDQTIGAFKALMIMHNSQGQRERLLNTKIDYIKSFDAGNHLKVIKVLEKVWRGRTHAPTCPHCEEAILSSDGLGDRFVPRKPVIERRRFPKVVARPEALSSASAQQSAQQSIDELMEDLK